MATTPYEADLAKHQKFLQRVAVHDAKATQQVIRAYDAAVADIEKSVKAQLKALKKAVDPADQQAISERLLVLRQRLASIEEVTQASLGVAGQEFSAAIAANAPKAYGAGLAHGYELMTGLVGSIERVNEALVTNTIARLQSGTLANAWLKEHTQTAGAAVRNSLSAGVAMGEGVDQLVRRIPLATKASKARAVTFVRTEILGAARTGNLQTYGANGIGQWRWNAAFDACMLCATRHGQVFPLATPMISHPSCRCSCDPVFPGVGNDPSVSEALFLERVPPATQLKVLGPSRYSAWTKGQVTFSGLSKEYSHPKYGPGLRATPLSQLGVPKLGKADIAKLTKSAKAADNLAKLAKAEAGKLTAIKAAKDAAKDPPKAPVVPFEKPKPPDPLPEAPVAVPEPAPVATKAVDPPTAHQQLDTYAKTLGYDPADFTGGALSEADIIKGIENLKASGSKLKPTPTNLELAARLADEGVAFPIAEDGLVKGFASTADILDLVKTYPGYANDLIPALSATSGTFDSGYFLLWVTQEGIDLPVGHVLQGIKWADEFVPGKAGAETVQEYLDLNLAALDDPGGYVAQVLKEGAELDELTAISNAVEDLKALALTDEDAWSDIYYAVGEAKEALSLGDDGWKKALSNALYGFDADELIQAAPLMKAANEAADAAGKLSLSLAKEQVRIWIKLSKWGIDGGDVPLATAASGHSRIAHWGLVSSAKITSADEAKQLVALLRVPTGVESQLYFARLYSQMQVMDDFGEWLVKAKAFQAKVDAFNGPIDEQGIANLWDLAIPQAKTAPAPAPTPAGTEWKKAYLLTNEEDGVARYIRDELAAINPGEADLLTMNFIRDVQRNGRDLTRFVAADFRRLLDDGLYAKLTPAASIEDRVNALDELVRRAIPETNWAWPKTTPPAVLDFMRERAKELGVTPQTVQHRLMLIRGSKARPWGKVMWEFDHINGIKRADAPTPAKAAGLGNRRLTRQELDELPDEGSVLEDMKPAAVTDEGKPLELDEIVAEPRNTPTPAGIGAIGDLTDVGPLPGSSHGGRIVRDAQGKEFIFKPATDATISEAELAASMLGRRLSMNVPDQAPATVGGQRGLLQAFVPKSQSKGKVIPFDPSFTPNEAMANQIVRHHIFDWFIGNHDTHAGNFLIGQEAKLWGVDKGQAWKFLGRDRWDPKWQAPGNHGEKIYRSFWDDVSAGKVKFNDEGWGLIDDIARMSEAEFVGIIKPYFDMLPDGQKQLALALERKRTIRKEWIRFLEERDVKFTRPGEQVDLGMKLPTPETKPGKRGTYVGHQNQVWQESVRANSQIRAFTGNNYSSYQREVAQAMRDGVTPPSKVQSLQKALLSAPVSDQPRTTLRFVTNTGSHHLGNELGIPELGSAKDLRDVGKYIGKAHQTDGFMSTTIKPGGIGMGGGGGGYFEGLNVGMRLTRPKGARFTYLDSVSANPGEYEALIEYGIVHRLRRVVVEGGSPAARTQALGKLWPPELGPRPSWLIDGGSGMKSPEGATGSLRVWFDVEEVLLD